MDKDKAIAMAKILLTLIFFVGKNGQKAAQFFHKQDIWKI